MHLWNRGRPPNDALKLTAPLGAARRRIGGGASCAFAHRRRSLARCWADARGLKDSDERTHSDEGGRPPVYRHTRASRDQRRRGTSSRGAPTGREGRPRGSSDHPGLVKQLILLSAGGMVPRSPEIERVTTRFWETDLARQDRLMALRRAFFASGNDARPWEEGWYFSTARAQRAADARTPLKE